MALIYKGVIPQKIPKDLGLPSLIVNGFASGALQLTVTPKGVRVCLLKSGQTVVVPVKPAAIVKLQEGKMDPITKHGLLVLFVQAVRTLIGEEKEMGAALDKLKAGSPATTTAPKSGGAYPKYDMSQIDKDPPVPLRTAGRLYQPVKGTDASSRYFMVGATDGLRVAARYSTSQQRLSIRIEGDDIGKHMKGLNACGFVGGVDNGYVSMHLQVHNDLIASKALGAVLLGLGVPLDTPVPDLLVIKNKGA